MGKTVGIIMGSDSDLKIMSEAATRLEKLGIDYEMTIISAHRTPGRFVEYVSGAEERGMKVLIAGAGGAAHLPGMAAALTNIPVIGVPIENGAMKGMDALFSIVQMPPGIPVATMAINGAMNAAIMAAKIIATYDTDVAEALKGMKEEMAEGVEKKAEKLESLGYAAYMSQM